MDSSRYVSLERTVSIYFAEGVRIDQPAAIVVVIHSDGLNREVSVRGRRARIVKDVFNALT